MASLHLTRLLRLLGLIRSRVPRTPKQLAEELGVTQRTVFRDVNVLRAVGMRCDFDKESGRYRVDGDFFLPPMQLILGEAMALSVICGELAGQTQVPFLNDAWQAMTKVRGQLPAAIRDSLTAVDGAVRVRTARVSPQKGCEAHFQTLRRAIGEKRKVKCTYARGPANCDGREDRGPFFFRPNSLFFGQRAWYAIGHSEKSGGERTLKLNRLQSVQPTDRPYGIPDGWSLEKSFGKGWRMIRGDRRYLVKVHFHPEYARNVADTLWHPTQTIIWESDGSCLFRCEVDGLDEIVWWVMGHGPRAEVIAPAELREQVR